MPLIAFRPLWRVGRRPSRSKPGAPPHAIDVLSGVRLSMQPMCRCERRPSASALHFSVHLGGIVLHAIAHLHARAGVHPHVQMACPERAMPMAWLALAGRQAAHRVAPLEHRITVPSGRGKMQGKIKGRGTTWREKPVCTWGWRGTRLVAAPCRIDSQGLVGIEESASLTRWASTVLDGGTA